LIKRRWWFQQRGLLDTLEDLTEGDFKKFKWFLQQAEILEGFPAVPKSQLENADRLDTVDQILDTYQDHAVEVIIKVLKKINKNDLVKRLTNVNSASKGEFRKRKEIS
uniref:Pyrin domain-containing protein n=1 Tax=Sphaeramia orbicularis TaxID=375764 RepID=A0A672ZXZ1_9TELE